MEGFLIFLVIGLFAAMLFVNVYFRIKVLKDYRVLVQNRIQFKARHVFNEKFMREEIISQHPEFEGHLLSFGKHLRYSISMATVLIALITIFGGILMYFR
jgi:hypothetical protein